LTVDQEGLLNPVPLLTHTCTMELVTVVHACPASQLYSNPLYVPLDRLLAHDALII
jgi:hypothetical protein